MRKISIYLAATALLIAGSCTDLNETLYDKVTPDSYGKTPSEIETIVGGAYASLRGYRASAEDYNYPTEWVWFIAEGSSDEAIVPTRGKDWYDGGRHQEMQMHTWTSSNYLVEQGWKYFYSGISKVNIIISTIESSSLSNEDKKFTLAELRGVRAFYYWWLCDLYGNVPLETNFNDTVRKTNSPRKDVYKFVESELLDIIDYLPTTGYGKFNRNAGLTLLARLYLNAKVYTGEAQWQKCIDACDKVSGVSLESDIFNNFVTNNQGSVENIFVIPYDEDLTVGNYQIWLSLHYSANLTTGSSTIGVNGICAEPGVYSMFDPADKRRACMKIGDQINIKTGAVEITYTEGIADWKNATVGEGVRYYKYPVIAGEKWERSCDYVLMRYSEVLLMKAEALLWLNQDALARPLIAQVRDRAGLTTPATVDLDFLYDELMFEFMWEGHRRTDNIRFDKYNVGIDVVSSTDHHLDILPIPKTAMELNNKLVQNPGY